MKLGAALRDEWLLEPGLAYLNHGSFGATPKRVLAVQEELRRRMERQPVAFMDVELGAQIRRAAECLATFLGAEGADLAFVGNATEAANAVAKSLEFGPGDEIVATSHAYYSIRNTLTAVCEASGARLVVAELPLPIPGPDAVVDAVARALSPRTKLLAIEHVTSGSAVVLPVARIVALARDKGVPVLVDGAHAAGMLDLEIAALGPQWYLGTCHKWLCAPKGGGFLWARRDAQAGIHPTVTSRGPADGFPVEFDWTGTRDYTPWLAVPAAIEFLKDLGLARARDYRHRLAADAGRMLAGRLGTELAAPDSMLGAMASVRLPESHEPTEAAAQALHDRLLAAHRIKIPVLPFGGALWLRLSAQVYNEMSDYERLADALDA